MSFHSPLLIRFFLLGAASFLVIGTTVLWLRFWVFRTLTRGRGEARSLRPQHWFICVGMTVWVGGGMALAGCLSGRPVFGLLTLVAVPWLLPLLLGTYRWQERRRMERAALTFLYALHGLLRAGLGLPSALFQLSSQLQDPFATGLQSALQSFAHGRSLPLCLSRFRRQHALGLTGTCLALLELTYRNGLSVVPLLERMLPVLEAEHEGEERVLALRRGAAGQIVIAFSIPWVLWAFLAHFQPVLGRDMAGNGLLLPTLGIALLWEIVGVAVLWRASRYL